jgi:NADPH2:quinone reductase
MIAGQYQEKPAFPFAPGLEAAGDILEVGEGVTHLQVGQRVAALCGHGGMAEEVVVNAGMTFPIPDNMSYEHAASFAVAYGTSHVALDHRGQLKAGEVLLVHGAAGGVGLTAVEIGKLMGATVIATASSDEKLALTQQYGADYTINYTTEDFQERVKELVGRVDVVYDPVGGDVFDQSLRCLNWEGRILVIGFASGRIPSVAANYALVKNISVVGVYWGGNAARKPRVITDSLKTLLGWYAQGKLNPHISKTFPLDQAPAAFNYLLSRRSTGKVVVTIP